MDSANSGSLQSSSGGDEEFDSRPDPLSAFFHSSTTAGGGAAASLPFYSLPDLSPSPLFPFDSTATATAAATTTATTSSSPWSRPFLPSSSQAPITTAPSSSSSPSGAATSAGSGGPPRSSRKRTRASRRAPTTILTTDTSNFRAMVQEFTGIPSPPFAPSPLTRSRFDHHQFSSASLPPYLLRPFAQKLQTTTISTPPTEATPSVTNPIPVTNNITAASGINPATANETLINMQNPILTFQSLLQSQLQPKYDNTQSMLTFTSTPSPTIHVSTEYVGSSTLAHGLIGSDGLHTGWPGSGSGSGSGSRQDMTEPNQLSPVVTGDYSSSQQQQRVSNSCKMNYTGSGSSEFANVEKGSETGVATTRGEGMMDSWLCSSSDR